MNITMHVLLFHFLACHITVSTLSFFFNVILGMNFIEKKRQVMYKERERPHMETAVVAEVSNKQDFHPGDRGSCPV